MQEGDGGRGETVPRRVLQRPGQGRLVQRPHDLAVRAQAFGGLHDASVERFRLLDIEGEEVGPRLIADGQGVAETAGGDQERACTLAFQQGIGGDGRAHLDGRHARGWEGRVLARAQQAAHALDRGVLIGGRGRQQFRGGQGPGRRAADHVGEGAAAVDPELPTVAGAVAVCRCHRFAARLDFEYSHEALAHHNKPRRPAAGSS